MNFNNAGYCTCLKYVECWRALWLEVDLFTCFSKKLGENVEKSYSKILTIHASKTRPALQRQRDFVASRYIF